MDDFERANVPLRLPANIVVAGESNSGKLLKNESKLYSDKKSLDQAERFLLV